MSAQPKVLTIPELGEAAVEGTVVGVLVAAGSMVEAGQSLLELETDKVTMEVPAECGGQILEIRIAVGQTVTGGTHFATLLVSADDGASPSNCQSIAQSIESSAAASRVLEHPGQPLTVSSTGASHGAVELRPSTTKHVFPAGPAARREARELGVNLSDVNGIGPRNRISRDDVRQHIRSRIERAADGARCHDPLPDLAAFGPIRSEPLPRIAQTTAKNMARSASVIPHAWIQTSADLTSLEASRREIRHSQTAAEAPLTLSVLILRAVAKQLVAHPRFNAAYDAENQALVMREYVNIGMAVASPRGLVVPVIRDPLAHDLKELSSVLDELITSAREQKLPLRAYQGAGFTISNLGGYGVESLQPLVNWPEVGILGVGALLDTPSVVDGQIVVRRCVSLTLGFDHRVINGADAADFLRGVRSELENPLRLAT